VRRKQRRPAKFPDHTSASKTSKASPAAATAARAASAVATETTAKSGVGQRLGLEISAADSTSASGANSHVNTAGSVTEGKSLEEHMPKRHGPGPV
jgi:hypothetical protein